MCALLCLAACRKPAEDRWRISDFGTLNPDKLLIYSIDTDVEPLRERILSYLAAKSADLPAGITARHWLDWYESDRGAAATAAHIASLQKCITANPKYVPCVYLLGALGAALPGGQQESATLLERTLDLDPNFHLRQTLVELHQKLLFELKDPQRAAALMEKYAAAFQDSYVWDFDKALSACNEQNYEACNALLNSAKAKLDAPFAVWRQIAFLKTDPKALYTASKDGPPVQVARAVIEEALAAKSLSPSSKREALEWFIANYAFSAQVLGTDLYSPVYEAAEHEHLQASSGYMNLILRDVRADRALAKAVTAVPDDSSALPQERLALGIAHLHVEGASVRVKQLLWRGVSGQYTQNSRRAALRLSTRSLIDLGMSDEAEQLLLEARKQFPAAGSEWADDFEVYIANQDSGAARAALLKFSTMNQVFRTDFERLLRTLQAHQRAGNEELPRIAERVSATTPGALRGALRLHDARDLLTQFTRTAPGGSSSSGLQLNEVASGAVLARRELGGRGSCARLSIDAAHDEIRCELGPSLLILDGSTLKTKRVSIVSNDLTPARDESTPNGGEPRPDDGVRKIRAFPASDRLLIESVWSGATHLEIFDVKHLQRVYDLTPFLGAAARYSIADGSIHMHRSTGELMSFDVGLLGFSQSQPAAQAAAAGSAAQPDDQPGGESTMDLGDGTQLFYRAQGNLFTQYSPSGERFQDTADRLSGSVGYFPDLRLLVDTAGAELEFRDAQSLELKFNLRLPGAGEWLAYTPEGHFDSSAHGADDLYWYAHDRYLPFEAFRQRLANANLVYQYPADATAHGAPAHDAGALLDAALAAPAPPRLAVEPDIFQAPYSFAIEGDAVRSTAQASETLNVVVTRVHDTAQRYELQVTLNGRRLEAASVACNGAETSNCGVHRLNVSLQDGVNVVQVCLVYRDVCVEAHAVSITRHRTDLPQLWFFGAGVSIYDDSSLMLQYPHADVAAVAAAFKAQERRAFSKVNLEMLLDEKATTESMLAGMQRFFRAAAAQDVLVVFFAGFGALDDSQQPYFLSYDTRWDEPYRGVGLGIVNELLARRPAGQRALVMLDICHAGAAGALRTHELRCSGSDDVKKVFSHSGVSVLTASTARELSLEGAQFGGGHGAFSWAVVKALKGAAAHGTLNLDELERSVAFTVNEMSDGEQHPSY